jgi:hypothetical protein
VGDAGLNATLLRNGLSPVGGESVAVGEVEEGVAREVLWRMGLRCAVAGDAAAVVARAARTDAGRACASVPCVDEGLVMLLTEVV